MMINGEKRYNTLRTHDEEILEDIRRGIVSEEKIHAFSRIVILNRTFDKSHFDIDYVEKLMLAKEEGLFRRKLMEKSFVSKFELSLWPPYFKIEKQRYWDNVDI